MKIINPSTEEIIKELPEDTAESVQLACKDLSKGQKDWEIQSIDYRISRVKKFSELLLGDIDRLSAILTSEVGKPLVQSANEIKGAAERIRYFIENSKWVLAERIGHKEQGLVEKVTFEPLGVIANISAWNYPYLVGVNVFIPALIAGNAVVYKPSEFSTLTGLEIEKLLQEAGVPADVFRSIVGGGEIGKILLNLPLDGYFFTGSNKTGSFIYQQVAKKMVTCQMELGGKDPMYVSERNSNILLLAQTAAEGAFYNNGQSCCAVERIYVHTEIYKEFLDEFVKEVSNYISGSPTDDGVFIGPLAREGQLDVLTNQVLDAIEKGAKLELGGKRMDRTGFYFEPTVFTNVNHMMLVMTEESFGPIIGIQEVKNSQEAVELMKDTEYGLTSAIYTEDRKEFEFLGKQMSSGTVYWNCCDRVSANVPWGGTGNSGFGSTLSEEGIKAFVKPKAWQMKYMK
ncbi:MAG: aldehyde dehydrogenase family protein [Cytophagales bacterium]|nr:aldehyde dehydrogenase family protein [Cytophagales bacterium]